MRQEYILAKQYHNIYIYYVYGLRERNNSWSNALSPPCVGHLIDPNVGEMDIVINLFVTITYYGNKV